MPEGPEIRRAADRVEAALKSRRLVSVRFGLAHLNSLETVITGCRVTRVDTRGKALLIRLDNSMTLYTHNQLYGRWFTGSADLRPNTRRQLRVALITDTTAALLYSASTIELLDPEALEVHPFLSNLVLFQGDIDVFSWPVRVPGKARLAANGPVLCKSRNTARGADRPTRRAPLWCPAAALRRLTRTGPLPARRALLRNTTGALN